MLSEKINLLDELDKLSNTQYANKRDSDIVMLDIAKHILVALNIERVNIWLFNEDKTTIVSIGEYDGRTKKFTKNSILKQSDFPTYFKALQENKIILAEDIYTHPFTKEFNDIYSKPHDIYSLLDIPLRICGELVGVICYEKTGEQKKYTENEISFALSVSLVLASSLEAKHRRLVQDDLQKLLEEKDLLINEINHRVTNNFTILISLMRLSKMHAHSEDSKLLLNEYEQRIFSMLKIHSMLNKGSQFAEINLADYLHELIAEYKATYPELNNRLRDSVNIKDVFISTKTAIYFGLITSEIILNFIKYKSNADKKSELSISLKKSSANLLEWQIGDNGAGFDFNEESKKSGGIGLSIIKDLSESLHFQSVFPTKNNAYFKFTFAP